MLFIKEIAYQSNDIEWKGSKGKGMPKEQRFIHLFSQRFSSNLSKRLGTHY